MCQGGGSNPRPKAYETSALTTELPWLDIGIELWCYWPWGASRITSLAACQEVFSSVLSGSALAWVALGLELDFSLGLFS